MLKWIVIAVAIIAGSIMTYFYVNLENMQGNLHTLPPVEEQGTVRVLHAFQDGLHRLVGQLRLPHSCYSVTSDVMLDPKNAEVIIVALKTKDNILEQGFCSQITTSYPFDHHIEASQSAIITLTVDGKPTPIRIVETKWQSPKGVILN